MGKIFSRCHDCGKMYEVVITENLICDNCNDRKERVNNEKEINN